MKILNITRKIVRQAIQSLALVGVLTIAPAMLSAADPVLTGRSTVRLSDRGQSEVKIAIKTQPNHFSALKQVGSNLNVLARELGMDRRDWSKKQSLAGQFIDTQNEVDLSYTTEGAVRNPKGNRWTYIIENQPDCQLVNIKENMVTLMAADTSSMGLVTMILEVELPKAATAIAFDQDRNEISYEFSPQVENGSHAKLEINVDHKPLIMSSLAKNYSNPKFNYMWAARAVAVNSGDQVLKNYRIRFRIADMGNWGPWQRTANVYPGQTVVDPYFPIFDLDKVMAMTGSRPTTIEAEYEYETADGKKVQDSDSFPIQVLSRNEVVYSSLNKNEIAGFRDQFDFSPVLITSMTTPSDPVVQQVAGRINGMAAETFGKTIGAIYSDKDCVAYMSAVWHFLQSNHIAYQAPTGNNAGGRHGQHVKYTRDVLLNRAGTCIDLAITWASVCEAVGLDPAVIMVPGHAFPAIRLPQSREWLALEATMLNDTFANAIDYGTKELKQALNGEHYLVDIKAIRAEGVLGLDLPTASEDFLTNLGYHFQAQRLNQAGNNQVENAQPEGQPAEQPAEVTFNPNGHAVKIHALSGTWAGVGFENGVRTQVGLALKGNGKFAIAYIVKNEKGADEETIVEGTWGMREGMLVLNVTDGEAYNFEVEVSQDQLKAYILGTDNPLVVMNRFVK